MPEEDAKLDLGRVPGGHVKRLRDDKPWTQQRLAEEAGVARTTVERIENGEANPGAEVLVRLAGALGVEVGEFFRGGTWMPSENDFIYEDPGPEQPPEK